MNDYVVYNVRAAAEHKTDGRSVRPPRVPRDEAQLEVMGRAVCQAAADGAVVLRGTRIRRSLAIDSRSVLGRSRARAARCRASGQGGGFGDLDGKISRVIGKSSHSSGYPREGTNFTLPIFTGPSGSAKPASTSSAISPAHSRPPLVMNRTSNVPVAPPSIVSGSAAPHV